MNARLLGIGSIFVAIVAWLMKDKVILQLPATDGDSLVNPNMTRGDVRTILRAKAVEHGYDPDWFDAIAKHESNWKLDARSNPSASDEKYGGAWGPMQVLKTNIERLGFTVEDVTSNAETAGECAARLMDEGRPSTFSDACAWWNAGKMSIDSAPTSTRETYYPQALESLAWVQSNPPEGTA